MSQPIPVDILSDSDSGSGDKRRSNVRDDAIDLTTPSPLPQSKKKQRTAESSNPSSSTVFIIDDDPTPHKEKTNSFGRTSSSTPSFVAETPFSDASVVKDSGEKCSFSGEVLATEQRVVADTPMSELLKPDFSIAKCNTRVLHGEHACSLITSHNSAEIKGWICVESDDESGDIGEIGAPKHNETVFTAKLTDESDFGSRLAETSFSFGTSVQFLKKPMQSPVKLHILEDCSSPGVLEDGMSEVPSMYCIPGVKHRYNPSYAQKLSLSSELKTACESSDEKASKIDPMGPMLSQQDKCYMKEKKKADKTTKPKGISKEERLRLMEEKKKLKEQEKLLKAASRAEAAEMKKCKKEMQKWEKGKYALKSIVAEIDRKVVELGSIGGHLLTRFAEKGLSYRIASNPVEGTIVWTMVAPEEISKVASERIEISYVLIVYEAEEFCNLIMNESLMGHVQSVQHRYPHHTICYITNRLMAYINKREQAQYKNPANHTGWKRPTIEEVLAKFATHFNKVHSRQCVDEAELAEHVVGLTCSLASCQFRKRLTRLSVNANGSVIPNDCVDKNLIKKNLWLKALVAIPKVQPRFAIAIWKKYPTMKSLLRVYMDPMKSVHEKEFLLKDLTTEGLFGDDRRLGEICSKRIYRILMAQSGNIKTDDVENGADFFIPQPT